MSFQHTDRVIGTKNATRIEWRFFVGDLFCRGLVITLIGSGHTNFDKGIVKIYILIYDVSISGEQSGAPEKEIKMKYGLVELNKKLSQHSKYNNFDDLLYFIKVGVLPAEKVVEGGKNRYYVTDEDLEVLAVSHPNSSVIMAWRRYQDANAPVVAEVTPVAEAVVEAAPAAEAAVVETVTHRVLVDDIDGDFVYMQQVVPPAPYKDLDCLDGYVKVSCDFSKDALTESNIIYTSTVVKWFTTVTTVYQVGDLLIKCELPNNTGILDYTVYALPSAGYPPAAKRFF